MEKTGTVTMDLESYNQLVTALADQRAERYAAEQKNHSLSSKLWSVAVALAKRGKSEPRPEYPKRTRMDGGDAAWDREYERWKQWTDRAQKRLDDLAREGGWTP